GIAAVGACFVLAVICGIAWIGHVNDAPKEHSNAAAVGHASAAQDEPGRSATEGAEEEHPVAPIVTGQTWFTIGGTDHEVGTLVDGLSLMMMLVVTIISLLVHIYSTDYVGGDRRYTHYFAFLSLFTASMLMLLMSRNTIQFITSWELVGLCSFTLIGHWCEEKTICDSAL